MSTTPNNAPAASAVLARAEASAAAPTQAAPNGVRFVMLAGAALVMTLLAGGGLGALLLVLLASAAVWLVCSDQALEGAGGDGDRPSARHDAADHTGADLQRDFHASSGFASASLAGSTRFGWLDDEPSRGIESRIDAEGLRDDTHWHHPIVNIDGTPMVNEFVDILGNPYGVTSDSFSSTSWDSMGSCSTGCSTDTFSSSWSSDSWSSDSWSSHSSSNDSWSNDSFSGGCGGMGGSSWD